jgi:hypothetical protein
VHDAHHEAGRTVTVVYRVSRRFMAPGAARPRNRGRAEARGGEDLPRDTFTDRIRKRVAVALVVADALGGGECDADPGADETGQGEHQCHRRPLP